MISCHDAMRAQTFVDVRDMGMVDGLTRGAPIVVFDEAAFVHTFQDLARRLPQLAAELADERSAWHPRDDLDRRGELTACLFSIPSDWRRRSGKRWLEWGDVLVELANPPNSDLTYLLPSGQAPEALRTPKALKDQGGLRRKQEVTELFLSQFSGRQLEGYWFYRRMADELRRVQVYCPQYDEFLNLKR